MKKYVIVKNNEGYQLIDTSIKNEQITYLKVLNGRLYKIIEHEKTDWNDYNLSNNTGPKIHSVKERFYVGKIVMESDDIEGIALEYATLWFGEWEWKIDKKKKEE